MAAELDVRASRGPTQQVFRAPKKKASHHFSALRCGRLAWQRRSMFGLDSMRISVSDTISLIRKE